MSNRALPMMIVAAVLFAVTGVVYANYQEAQTLTADELDCDRCHTCEKPTARDLCLKPCFRHTARAQSSRHSIGEAPDSILLDELATDYLPILFDHRPHAEMAGMSDNCATCHHYSPEGEIPPCRSCHPKDAASINFAQPDLKTAYHRQCLVCHSQWAHEALCDVCHQPPGEGAHMPKFVRGNFTMPTVNVPIAKTYMTTYKSAPVVTFQHIEHIELFQFECVECHQHENCRYCHDQVNREGLSKPLAQVHSICSNCHEIGGDMADATGCGECHDRRERSGLFHSVVGFKLPPYLEHVGCGGCHVNRGPKAPDDAF
ncbi:MAG: cytochrome c3 family protein [Candidatus Zixiibacteriota bacterium]|nr:MAG: cytochrome c3 family protein [candidate division Zixibacteria bacterium]